MKKSNMFSLMIVLTVGVFALWGCPKKSEVSSAPAEPSRAEMTSEMKPATAEERADPVSRPEEKVRTSTEGLKSVYFDYDEAAIRAEAKPVIEANAASLRANPKALIRIEGNCDERGTKEYNLALGQRRAANIGKYLAALGIAEGRIALVSFGKEKPVCTQQTEECMQKNRRGDLIVTEASASAAN
jgi:peptidoglycan-associated lipoprotein